MSHWKTAEYKLADGTKSEGFVEVGIGHFPIPVYGELEEIVSYRYGSCAGCEWHPNVCEYCEGSL